MMKRAANDRRCHDGPPPPHLVDWELEDITRRIQGAAQCRQLARMGVPFRVRADGSPLVWRWDAQRQERAASAQPRWSRAA